MTADEGPPVVDLRPFAGAAVAEGGAAARARAAAHLGPVMTSVVEVVVPTLAWFALGRLVDLVASTGPWVTFIGACLGCWTGLYLGWARVWRQGVPVAEDLPGAGSDAAQPTADPRQEGADAPR